MKTNDILNIETSLISQTEIFIMRYLKTNISEATITLSD